VLLNSLPLLGPGSEDSGRLVGIFRRVTADSGVSPLPLENPEADEPTPLIPLTAPAEGVPGVINNPKSLEVAAAAIAGGSGPVAIDAERAGGYRYGQNAYLVQIRRTGSGTHLIDPIGFANLKPIADAIGAQEWILHAASQDLPCLADLGLAPQHLFDTEMAARILGRPKVGLAALAGSELGLSLAKEHSAADWSNRPLPKSWLTYAALDVELLVELRDILEADLERTGRLTWATEEFEYLRTAPAKAARHEPWRRTSGIHRIRNARGLAVVRELWQARDRLAADRDIAPGRVLADNAIAAAGSARPQSQPKLAELPEYRGKGTRRRLGYWWRAIECANQLPIEDLPELSARSSGPPPPRSWSDRAPQAAARLSAAKAFLAEVSEQSGIPTENVLTPDTVRRLCWEPPTTSDEHPVASYLRQAGARNWQIELTLTGLTGALGATPPSEA
jgi:ribonuclease D